MSSLKMMSNISDSYPSNRDDTIRTSLKWLDGKRLDDRAEGLWRIHDTLYDFDCFLEGHPGGADWLKLTKGTDITEAFESHHISKLPKSMLAKYAVRKAQQPRLFKFTYHEHGFYKTLQRQVREKMTTIDESPKFYSKVYNDCLIFLVLFFALLAAKYTSYGFGLLSGLSLALLTISGHNFLHQKPNWRKVCMNFGLQDFREFEIVHVLSHHLYPNSLHDLEISLFEPFFLWLPHNPDKKNRLRRYAQYIWAPFVYCSSGPIVAVKKIFLPGFQIHADFYLPLSIPLVMLVFTKVPLATCAILSMFIFTVCSCYFFTVAFNSAHHHPDTQRDGDVLGEDMDWGMYQVMSVMSRSDVVGSQFLTQTHYGEHTLHHLFPSLDHGLLPQLKPILVKTCKEFGFELLEVSWWHQIVGQLRQLRRLEINDFKKKPFIKPMIH